MKHLVSDAGRRAALYALYRPNTGNGNYRGDVFTRGQNEGVKQALLALGLECNAAAVERRFKVMDEQQWDEREERLQRFNAERVKQETPA